jgi:broad specificity phosphatase PhoE
VTWSPRQCHRPPSDTAVDEAVQHDEEEVERMAGRMSAGGSEGGVVPQSAGRRIFLVRHGRTSLNAAGLIRGRLDPELDETGLAEANAVADAIASRGLMTVLSSPLRRAVDTAAHIGARAGTAVRIDERLIDRDYGSWAGKAKSELLAQWGSLDAAPGVEPSAEVLARAMDAFDDVARRDGSGWSALVTHDAVLQLLLPALDPRLDRPDPLPQHTGCFNVLEENGDGWIATEVDVTPARRHTDDPPSSRPDPIR